MSPAERVLSEADRLRSLGWNPIPVLNAIGHCPVPHASWRDNGMPSDIFGRIVRRHHTHGLQVPTGIRWRIAVVDVDGEYGLQAWDSFCIFRPVPPTVSARTPRDGWQFWFSIPEGIGSLPSLDLWKGSGDHQGIELLADRKLARCYPSYKVVNGERREYAWTPGRAPWEHPLAPLPAWIVEKAERSVRPRGVVPDMGPKRSTLPLVKCSRGDNWRGVKESISDKVSVAQSWGLRVVGSRPNPAGWIKCRSIFREDRNPSAMIEVREGMYWEAGLSRAMSFYDLLMALRGLDFASTMRELEAQCGLARNRAS